jgi:hypothetical protein
MQINFFYSSKSKWKSDLTCFFFWVFFKNRFKGYVSFIYLFISNEVVYILEKERGKCKLVVWGNICKVIGCLSSEKISIFPT